ncbi:uncharacterized protein Bfra_007948 [Botrytis fragariae]|uniref:Uncharacterized protein n=1 Tax=Botrytis fragariae TaxID=1964551 RepID=A0A8H6APR9_9HELO|nr:uncharacterized protein Bfra_007948 [Botrytis fragariae]KAF5871432.1 hypothetical protein Bfra_007948 [Botrytis fragariae]
MSFFSYGVLVRLLTFRNPIVYQLAIVTNSCATSPKNYRLVDVLNLCICECESSVIERAKPSFVNQMPKSKCHKDEV